METRSKQKAVVRIANGGRIGFTLIELLTVVAIITLLIGILVPALTRAREQAKSAATRAIIKSAGDGLDMFKNENPRECRGGDGYPESLNRDDPTESGAQNIFGAQWLVRYLLGKNLDGYIPARNVPRDVKAKGEALWEQKDWYATAPTQDNPYAPLDKVGPYLESTSVRLEQPRNLEGAEEALASLGGLEDDRWKQSVILDNFDQPILYYSANTRLAKSQRGNAQIAAFGCDEMTCYDKKGVYVFSDNAVFTGMCGSADGGAGTCLIFPWDFAGVGRDETSHKLASFGNYDPEHISDNMYTFAYYILDKAKWEATYDETTERGTVVPYRSGGFILISAGPDGVYGTTDDVNNF